MNVSVIIPAAGLGKRFSAGGSEGGLTKIERDLAGKPVFLRSIERFIHRPDVGEVLLAVHPQRIEEFTFRWGDKLSFLGVKLIPGGTAERWETVLKALDEVAENCTHIAVHDAARPLVSDALIDRVFAAAEKYGAAVPGMAVANTLKRICDQPIAGDEADPMDAILGDAGKPDAPVKQIIETISRANLVAVQTPQVFEASLLRQAYEPLRRTGAAGVTDDANLVEALGEQVVVVAGEVINFKITHADDAAVAAAWLEKLASDRVKVLSRKTIFAEEE